MSSPIRFPAVFSTKRPLLGPQDIPISTQTPIGARLSLFAEGWGKITQDRFVLRVVREGYRLPLRGLPPLRTSPREIQLPKGKVRRAALLTEIQALRQKGAVAPGDASIPGFYSHVFVVPKASGGWRPVIDLKALNTFVDAPHFRMHTVNSVLNTIRVGDWAFSIDLKDAYLHVPMHPDSRKYLRFALSGEILEFRALPFGLNTAPRVFTRIAHAVSGFLHQKGVSVVPYLDDWLIHNPNREVLLQHRTLVLETLQQIGLIVNLQKSQLEPSQDLEFLGVRFQFQRGIAQLPLHRAQATQALAIQMSRAKRLSYHEAASLQGSLNWAASWIPLGRLHLRPLQQYLRSKGLAVRSCPPQRVDPDRMAEMLAPWRVLDFLTRGIPIQRFRAQCVIHTDASEAGWGAHLEGAQASGLWGHSHRGLHINHLELQAVFLALQAFLPQVHGRHVLVATDNTSVVAYINHQGGTHSAGLLQGTLHLLTWCNTHNIQLRARHIPGKLNVIADRLSRSQQVIPTEWKLHPQVVQALFQLWGTPKLDLFATRFNNQLPLFVSPLQDSRACAVDALSLPWEGLWAYAFPPPPLLSLVLSKVAQEGAELILIAPLWPAQPWFPRLLELTSDFPRQLPPRSDLLSQPGGILSRGDQFRLLGWRLSPPTSSMAQAFQRKLRSASPPQSEPPQLGPMTAGGRNGLIGQRNGAWIRSLPL